MTDVQEMLAQAAAGGPIRLESLVVDLLRADPELSPYLPLIAPAHGIVDGEVVSRAEEPATRREEPDDSGDPVTGTDREEVIELIESLWAELEGLRARTEQLADALGACALCWGDDGACRRCRGRGRTGGRRPDPTLFDELVAPALHRLRRPALVAL
jgi:hypothetical protein